ncbi:hypothetical protein XENOCAPTIV_029117 [Xenoophorus captivus]|uniref:Uncharacterized protein n=1 Tax=Xenoophorus captivus TaxID=1517983 RepID=A0ABV0Q6S7_9TELE
MQQESSRGYFCHLHPSLPPVSTAASRGAEREGDGGEVKKRVFMVASRCVFVEIIVCQETRHKHRQSFSLSLACVDVPAEARHIVRRHLLFSWLQSGSDRERIGKEKRFLSSLLTFVSYVLAELYAPRPFEVAPKYVFIL